MNEYIHIYTYEKDLTCRRILNNLCIEYVMSPDSFLILVSCVFPFVSPDQCD